MRKVNAENVKCLSDLDGLFILKNEKIIGMIVQLPSNKIMEKWVWRATKGQGILALQHERLDIVIESLEKDGYTVAQI